jgi:hypothetical protein
MDDTTKPTLFRNRRRFTLTVREQWLAALSGKASEDDSE